MTDKKQPETQQADKTASTNIRWWLSNDISALLLTVSLVALMLADVLGQFQAPTIMRNAYVVAVGVAVVWLFGADTLRAWRGGDKKK